MKKRRQKKDDSNVKFYESTGALHMHTTYSDGTGTVPQIARYASRHRLEWIIITDHSHLKAKDAGEEGRHSSVWVLVGSELGDEDRENHYLAFNIDRVPEQSDPVDYVRQVKELGGFGAIAHPHEKRDEFKTLPPYPWTAWDADIEGIEIWNQLSQWVEGLTKSNQLMRFMHPLKSLTRPDPETMATWDRLNRFKKVVGYVGVDAHALKYPLFFGLLNVKVFHYKVQFRSLRTHLILEEPLDRKDFSRASRQIYTALQNGNHFGSNNRVGNAKGFRFYAIVDGKIIIPAARIDPGKKVEFVVNTPLEAEIRLLCNGKEIISVKGKTLKYASFQEGVWRVEAHRKNRGWIYSNPIRLLHE